MVMNSHATLLSTTMVECAAANCTEDGKSQCSRCKSRFYCSPACQQRDWPAHKAECKRLVAIANAPISSLGHILNPDGTSNPMSNVGDFFNPMFGYTPAHPETVYKDIVSAYHVLRLGAHPNAPRVSAAMQGMPFSEWMERFLRVGILPSWWDTEVNGAGIEAYTREDAFGRLDRDVKIEELSPRSRLGMIVERILNMS
ncbi:hypothetical protein C8R46DRAFT_1087613 [Mycena filopes]|nr:hypothetical protein C8R46DRAFT_1087613 [Mycena filopes]